MFITVQEVTPVIKRLLAVLCVLSMLTLSGCDFTHVLKSTDDLYALPQASEEYTSLQTCLQQLLDSGLEYAPPLSGSNTQPVQLKDLDRDGEDEALAFFRESSAKESPLKIYIFKKDSDDVYQEACVIVGDGTDINSVLVCQLIGGSSSAFELVVSWQVSSAVYTLSAYSLADYRPTELMTPTPYTRYSAMDMDGDGEDELILMTIENSDNSASSATYYDNTSGTIEVSSSANLSACMSSIDKIKSGVLADGTPVLYVTGAAQDTTNNAPHQITDILTLQEGVLANITLNQDTLSSDSTVRYNLTSGQDINGDGVLEIPIPFTLDNYDTNASDTFYAIHWRQYSADGSYTVVSTTYYNSADGWYLELPEEWMDQLSLARRDITVSSTNERGVLFYYCDTPFLAICKNTGTNREKNASANGRIVLARDSSAIYSLELFDSASGLILSAGDLSNQFHLITTDWSTD